MPEIPPLDNIAASAIVRQAEDQKEELRRAREAEVKRREEEEKRAQAAKDRERAAQTRQQK
jgi:hypothetical protein